MHGVWGTMDLAGNVWEERGAGEMGCQKQVASLQVRPENYKPCNLVSRAHSVTGCRFAHCAMQPRRQSLLGHGLSPYKKAKKQIFLRERAPDEAAGVCLFAWLVAFVKI